MCRRPQQFCEVQRGGRVLSRIRFAVPQSVNQVRATAAVLINGQLIDWPLNRRSNVCDFLMNDAQCPLRPNTPYIYELRATFPLQVPVNQPIHVEFTLRDDAAQRILSCFRTRVTASR